MFSFGKVDTSETDGLVPALLESGFEIDDTAGLLLDAHGHVIQVNPAFSAMFGYTGQEITGQSVETLVEPGTGLQDLLMPRQLGSASRLQSIDQLTFINAKEEPFQGAVRGCKVVSSAEDTLGFFLSVYDLRVSRRISDRLELAELRLKQALDAVDDGAWSLDVRTGVSRNSSKLMALLGLPEADDAMLHQVQFLECVHPGDVDMVRGRFAALSAGQIERFDDEFRLNHPDGGFRWVRNKGRVIECDRSGNPVRASGLLRDIDERKRLELQARETDQLFREALQAVGQTLWTTDFAASIVRIEGPLAGRLGASGPGCQSLSFTQEAFRERVHPDDLVRSMAAWETAVKTELEAYEFEGRMLDVAGNYFMVRLRARVAERDARNQPLRATGFIYELDDRSAPDD